MTPGKRKQSVTLTENRQGAQCGRGLRGAALMLALCLRSCSEVVAQTRDAAPAQTNEASASGQDRGRGRISKFEARRLRHACRDEAQKPGVGESDRSAFVSACVSERMREKAGTEHRD
jgi:hypothetical protein